jgi:sugar phosphate isomerase/epimerase
MRAKILIIMHVNYCEQGQTLDEISLKAVAWGFDGVEFRQKRTGVKESAEEYLDALLRAQKRSGLKIVIFGSPGPDLMTPDPARRAREVEEVKSFYRLAARRFKLSVCNTFTGPLKNPDASVPYYIYEKQGSAVATPDQWKWAVEGFKSLGALAAELGFRFAFETHMTYLHDLPATARQLVDRIGCPSVGVNLDYGNTVYFPKHPSLKEAISEIGPSLYYVHLKNCQISDGNERARVGLADGDINHREYLRLLAEAGYRGPLCIEAPRPGDREWYARQDIAYLKSVIADLAKPTVLKKARSRRARGAKGAS